MPTLVALRRYPLKSALGESLDAAEVDHSGLAGDRIWACVDTGDGTVGSAKHPRRWGRLLEVRAALAGDELTVHVGGAARRAGSPAADDALSGHLGRPVRLTRSAPAEPRLHRVVPDEAGMIPEWMAGSRPGDETMSAVDGVARLGRFADFGALHVVTTGELARLGERLGGSAAAAARFRPNLILDLPRDPEPGTELRLGDVVLRVALPTPRCVVPAWATATSRPTGPCSARSPATTASRFPAWAGPRVSAPTPTSYGPAGCGSVSGWAEPRPPLGQTGPMSREALGVAVAGFGWMGRVHTQSYLRVLHHFPQLTVRPELVAVADEVPGRAAEAAERYGFATATLDWRELAADPRVRVVSIAAPNFLHRELGVALARAGKHIWIEKPVGLDAADAHAVAGAVHAAGVQGTVGFNYRHAPAVAAARDLIARGELGTVTHARFRLLSDYAAHPQGALSWRFERARGGHGVLGDLASHGVDLVRHLLGDIDALVADTATFVPRRPRPAGATAGHTRAEGGEPGPVENEDYVAAQLRLASGARVVLEASRVAVGQQNNYGFEVQGMRGALAWDFRRMGELSLSVGDGYQDLPARTVYVGPGDGEYAAFQPGAGIAMGYDDLKVIEAYHVLRSVAEGRPYGATVDDAVHSALALDAMTRSVATGAWTSLR
ncbi:hypothetical protein GCM10020358_78580 [Amorphoplanes nipponensis]|uniref:MOSC domain-containing protein n=1 Tax=Actinoplanes nipponensis TaxID=135950 RepID=A0A919JP64_9ACTN|nr:Gfo/Idh/MocA family oxidoreductase [Actinoplanes nipponensis]GIE52800.1 hypothetical protein Ani05nite_63340 [Actinoplanes nipponensis]